MGDGLSRVIEDAWNRMEERPDLSGTALDLLMLGTGIGVPWVVGRTAFKVLDHVRVAFEVAGAMLPEVTLENDGERLIDRFSDAGPGRTEWLDQIRSDVVEFERRAERDGLEPSEVTRTYDAIERLLEDRDGAAIDREQRLRLAAQALHHAAHPFQNDQGRHRTCSVTSLESRLYARNPSQAISVIADIATSAGGEFRTTEGRTVAVDRGSLRPDSEAEQEPVPDGQRDYASQILQLAMVSAAWDGRDVYREGDREWTGPFRYVQRHGVSESDSGERLLDGAGNEVDRAPSIRIAEMPALYRQFSREDADPFLLVRHDRLSTSDGSATDNVVAVQSAEDLLSRIQALQERENMPLVISVDPEREPWRSQSGRTGTDERADSLPLGEEAGAAAMVEVRGRSNQAPSEGVRPAERDGIAPGPDNRGPTERNPHTINIVRCYQDPQSGRWMVDVSNHWGDRSDITIDVATLFGSL